MKFSNNKLALSIFVAIFLNACSPSKTSDEYITSAKVHISNNQQSDALIELKNAIRLDLKNVEARILLGSLYLESGQAAAAEKELTKALKLGGYTENIFPKILKAFNLQNKNKETIDLVAQYGNVSLEILPEVLVYQALAYERLGEKEKSKQALVEASEISAESIYSRLSGAYIKAGSSDVDGALTIIEKILSKSPNLTEALMLQGQLFFSKNDYANAIKAFNKYHKLLPQDTKIKLLLANSYINNKQFNEGGKHLKHLFKIFPKHPFSNQLQAIVDFHNENWEQALLHAETAMQNGLDIPASKVIAGISAFKLNKSELSYQYLLPLKDELSNVHPVKKILAIVQMELGYNLEASDTFNELKNLTEDDTSLLASASFELLKSGQILEATTLINRIKTIGVDDSKSIAKLGMLKLSIDDLEGITDLEKALEMDADLPVAKLALVNAYIQSKEYEKALMLAKNWQNENPDKVDGFNLAAKVLFIIGKNEEAEAALNRALQIDANNAYSLLYFSAKDISDQKPKKAIEKLSSLLEVQPFNRIALIQNYRAFIALGEKEKGVEYIKNAFVQNEENIHYRLLYAQALEVEQKYEYIIELLSAHNKLDVNTPRSYWKSLGLSYSKLQRYKQALTIYTRWMELHPDDSRAWVGKMITQERLIDFSGALKTAKKYVGQNDGNKQVKLPILAYYLALNEKYGEAQNIIDNLTFEQKSNPIMEGVQGQVLLYKGLLEQALVKLKIQYENSPSYRNTWLVYVTLTRLKQNEESFKFLRKHVNTHANDLDAKSLLAEISIKFDKSVAKKNYQKLLESSPNNVGFINNLSWVEYQLSNLDVANKLIQRAIELEPNNPHVLDTAALIQFKLGNVMKAKALITKAKQLAPTNENILTHYAQINSN